MKINVAVRTTPEVLSIAQLVRLSGRKTVYIHMQIELNKLDHSFLFQDEGTEDKGIKVVIKNGKYEAFIQKCVNLDSAKR